MGDDSEYRTWSRSRAARLRLRRYPACVPAHLVIGTHRRRPVFLRTELATAVFQMLERHPRTLVAVLMPDHLHWLIDNAENLIQVVAGFKSISTRRSWDLGVRGRLWQRSFFDNLLRSPQSLEMTVQYVLENPARARLEEGPGSYPWSIAFFDRFPDW